MPRPPSSPFEDLTARILRDFQEQAQRFMEEHFIFPLMDQVFASIPSPPKRRRIRVDSVRERSAEERMRKLEAARARASAYQQRVRARPGFAPPTHYDTLQVSRKADQETIQAAWRSLSLRFHPDRNPGNPRAAERMVRINQAWEVLGDPAKRAAYDRTLG